jgi:hypothetical protein
MSLYFPFSSYQYCDHCCYFSLSLSVSLEIFMLLLLYSSLNAAPVVDPPLSARGTVPIRAPRRLEMVGAFFSYHSIF